MPLDDSYIRDFSNATFIFGNCSLVEEVIICEIAKYISRLKQRKVPIITSLSNIYLSAIYPKKIANYNQIIVECVPNAAAIQSFGNLLGRNEDAAGNTWVTFGGQYEYTLSITFRSINRRPVSILADIVLVGLLKPINDVLLEIGVEIPINNINLARIVPVKEPGYENLFELSLTFPGTRVDWRQMFREDGVIIAEIGVQMIKEEIHPISPYEALRDAEGNLVVDASGDYILIK